MKLKKYPVNEAYHDYINALEKSISIEYPSFNAPKNIYDEWVRKCKEAKKNVLETKKIYELSTLC